MYHAPGPARIYLQFEASHHRGMGARLVRKLSVWGLGCEPYGGVALLYGGGIQKLIYGRDSLTAPQKSRTELVL